MRERAALAEGDGKSRRRSATWRASAGVSVGTVSRSLNAPDSVRPATLDKVRAAIQALGFQPDPRAQNMRRRSTMTVGFIVDDIANPLHAATFKAADAEMRGRGFSLYLVNTNGERARGGRRHRHAPARPRRRPDHDDQQRAGRADAASGCEELRVPSVLLDREIPLDIDAVLTDHAARHDARRPTI